MAALANYYGTHTGLHPGSGCPPEGTQKTLCEMLQMHRSHMRPQLCPERLPRLPWPDMAQAQDTKEIQKNSQKAHRTARPHAGLWLGPVNFPRVS